MKRRKLSRLVSSVHAPVGLANERLNSDRLIFPNPPFTLGRQQLNFGASKSRKLQFPMQRSPHFLKKMGF